MESRFAKAKMILIIFLSLAIGVSATLGVFCARAYLDTRIKQAATLSYQKAIQDILDEISKKGKVSIPVSDKSGNKKLVEITLEEPIRQEENAAKK